MFAKLLKHEWKATGRLLGILSLAAIGMGIVAAIALRLLLKAFDIAYEQAQTGMMLMAPALTLLLVFAILSLVIYAAAVQFLLLHRFYKNKFTDEGYLTFTLPVNVHQILLSSWLNMLMWTAISFAAVIASFSILMLFGTADQGLVNTTLLADFFSLVEEILLYTYEDFYDLAYSLFLILTWLIQALTAPLILMTCVTIGSIAAKRHKLLLSFGIYYIYTMVLSMGTSIVESLTTVASYNSGSNTMLYIRMIGELVLHLTVGIIGYFLSAHLMKNKLNLP